MNLPPRDHTLHDQHGVGGDDGSRRAGDVAVISSDHLHPLLSPQPGTTTTTVGDQAGGGLARHDLFLAGPRSDRGPLRRITTDGEDGWDSIRPKWSPDGRHIERVQQRRPAGERVALLTLSCAPRTT